MAKIRTKVKKLLALTLALSMTMGLLNLTAFAAGGDKTLTVKIDSTLDLSQQTGGEVTFQDADTADIAPGYTWESSDPNIATVDGDGVVTGIAAGTVTITRSNYVYLWEDPDGVLKDDYYDLNEVADPDDPNLTPMKRTVSWQVDVTDSVKLVLSYVMNPTDASQLVGDSLTVDTDPNVQFKVYAYWQITDPDTGTVRYQTAFRQMALDTAPSCAAVDVPAYNTQITISGNGAAGTDTAVFTGTYMNKSYTYELEITASDDLVQDFYVYGSGSPEKHPVNGILSMSASDRFYLYTVPADSTGAMIPHASFATSLKPTYELISNEDGALELRIGNYVYGLQDGSAELQVSLDGYEPKIYTIQVGDPVYTAELRFYVGSGADFDAEDILAAFPQGTLVPGAGTQDYVSISTVEISAEDQFKYYNDFSIGNTTRDPAAYAETLNSLFFEDEEVMTPAALSNFYFNGVGSTWTFVTYLQTLPGSSTPKPDPDQQVTLTLINLDNTVEPITTADGTVYPITQDDIFTKSYNLNDTVSINVEYPGDPDDPVTGWAYAQIVTDEQSGSQTAVIGNRLSTSSLTMSQDITLYAYHNNEPHYIRIVVLGDKQATNLIQQGMEGNSDYDEVPIGPPYYDEYYLPVDFGGRVDATYEVNLSEFDALYPGWHSDSAQQRGLLLDFMKQYSVFDEVTASLENGDKVFYSTDGTRYHKTRAYNDIEIANGIIPAETTLTIVTYIISLTDPSYDLVVRYLDEDTQAVLAEPYTVTLEKGTSYDVTAYTEKEIGGYTLTHVTGDQLTGTMDGSKEITVWYAKKDPPVVNPPEEDDTPTTIPGDDDEPSTDLPDEDTPTTELPDEDTPTTQPPVGETPDEDPAELPEEDVPMAEAPETGDASLLWLAAAALSGSGLAWLALSERKRREQE